LAKVSGPPFLVIALDEMIRLGLKSARAKPAFVSNVIRKQRFTILLIANRKLLIAKGL
jgi:hypothetical protein